MEEEKVVRLSIEIPESEHKYLKMCCTKLGISMKEFVLKATIERVDLHEDDWMIERWKKEGRDEEFEKEQKDENRIVYVDELVDGEHLFKPVKYCEMFQQRKLELAGGI